MERLGELYFLNAPFIFWGLWRLIAPLVHPATRAKIRFASGGAGRAALLAAVDPHVLPAAYGGAAELVPIDAAVAARRQLLLAAAAAAAAAGGGEAGPGGAAGRKAGEGQGSPLARARRRAVSAGRAASAALQGKLGGAAQRLLLRLPSGKGRGGAGGELGQAWEQVLLRQVLLPSLLLTILREMFRWALLRALHRGGAAALPGSVEEAADPTLEALKLSAASVKLVESEEEGEDVGAPRCSGPSAKATAAPPSP